MITQLVQGHQVTLRSFHDLSFVDAFGQVLRVYDQMDSGLLAFKMARDGQQFMLRYAGAPTLNAMDSPLICIGRLREAAPRYEQLRHPALVRLRAWKDYGSGLACLFDWVDGLPLAPLRENYAALRAAGLLERLRMMDMLADLHAACEALQLVVAGLQDSDLSYVPGENRLVLLRLDDYLQMPAMNLRGRLPGSPLYLAPEAYERGAALDETTSVYALGALAFTLFGNRASHGRSGWEAAPLLYEVAARALQQDRNQRQQSVQDFLADWREALRSSPLH
ncbi:MAG: hypothetical protein AB9880_04680 [Christensenellales bacterium]